MTLGPWGILREAFRSKDPVVVSSLQRARLAEAVAHSRAHSPYYQALYQNLPERVEDPTLLPVTNKQELMANFDDWSTDREVTLEKARAFASNPEMIGERFLGRYTVLVTSGTTGKPGVFVVDDYSMQVTHAVALRLFRAWLGWGDVVRVVAGGARLASVYIPGVHAATTIAVAQLKWSRARQKRTLALPVHTPLPEMVSQLNTFRPAVLAVYASIAKLLAAEQEAGRLNIHPVLVAITAEGLPIEEHARIAKAFRARVGNSYAATECPFLSVGCSFGWLHVNSDWAVLEPVDANYRPVPPGEQSHTVLVSNLANRVQPILRYDLGDRVIMRPDPCECGNPLPAIRVQGRTANVLTFSAPGGERVSIPPLAFEVDHVPGVALFQVVQNTPSTLRVRLRYAEGADPTQVWQAVHDEITRLLVANGLPQVVVERAEEAPERSPGGKFRTVIPLAAQA